jgi:chromosome segregation ATPase
MHIQQQTINEQLDIHVIRNHQEISNELTLKNETLQEQLNKYKIQGDCDELLEKNENLLYQVEEYRTECKHLTESLTGIQNELSGVYQDLRQQH